MQNLFIITIYFILVKDLLRFIEHYFSIPIPLNIIPLTLVVLSVFVYLYDLRRYRVHYYNLVALHLICIDFITLSIVILSFPEFTLRDNIGILYIHILIPLFVVLASNKLNFYSLFFEQKKLFPIIILIISVGIMQMVCFNLYPEQSIRLMDLFYRNGWISWPFQVSATGIYPRVVSIFYASFPFGLFIVFLYTVLIFSPMQTKRKIILSVPLILLLFFTYNRNSYLAIGVVSVFKMISMLSALSAYKSKSIMAGLFLILLTVLNLFAPMIITSLPASYFTRSEDPFTKTTTVGSRVKAWRELTMSLDDEDFIFGKGTLQGTKNSTMLADNFIIYKLQLNGFLLATFWLVFFLMILWGVIKALLQRRRYGFLNAGLLGAFLAMANFNILYYEPIFQSLYLGMILSILRAGEGLAVEQQKCPGTRR